LRRVLAFTLTIYSPLQIFNDKEKKGKFSLSIPPISYRTLTVISLLPVDFVSTKIYKYLRESQNKKGKRKEKILGKMDKQNNPKTDKAFCDHRRSFQEKKDRTK
jgi:hypothetical protein